MQKIFKYKLDTSGEQEITMPAFSKILCVKNQHNVPCLWAMIDTDSRLVKRKIITFLTGADIEFNNQKYEYIGTYLMNNGSFVGHVYEEK
jgi:hypothetical protein